MDFWERIEKEDFKDDMALLVEVVGLAAAKKIVEIFGGDSIYVPKSESVIRMARDRQIYQEFNGRNVRDLMQQYNLTARHIRGIIGEQKAQRPKAGAKEEELSLF